MKQINWLFLVVFSLSFFACDDDDDVVVDTTPPTINITSPGQGATFARTDVIVLRAEIRDNMGLEQVRVTVTDPNQNVRQISDQSINDFLNDNREKDLDLNISLDANAPVGTYVITVEADDERDNTASRNVTVSIID